MTKNVLKPVEVVRDKNGMFVHPDLDKFLEFSRVEIRGSTYLKMQNFSYIDWHNFITQQNIEVQILKFVDDAQGNDLTEDYQIELLDLLEDFMNGDATDISGWNPTKPEGEGWFILLIESINFGGELVCWWARSLNSKASDLQAEIERLKKDEVRLDWLADVKNKIGNVQLPTVCVEINLHSLRAAIDAAMKIEHDQFTNQSEKKDLPTLQFPTDGQIVISGFAEALPKELIINVLTLHFQGQSNDEIRIALNIALAKSRNIVKAFKDNKIPPIWIKEAEQQLNVKGSH